MNVEQGSEPGDSRTAQSVEGEPMGLERFLRSVDEGEAECVDERGLVGQETRKNHAKLPGGSEHIVDMFEVAFAKAGLDLKHLPNTKDGQSVDALFLVQMANQVHASETAKKYGVTLGVHIDDDHGKIREPEIIKKRTKGCGHDNVRQHSIEAATGVQIPDERANMVPSFIESGAAVSVYTGGHYGNARAAENHRVGTSFDSQTALNEDIPAFDHDIWLMKQLAPVMAEVVTGLGGDYEQAAEMLTEDNVAEWSGSIYRETLRDLGGPADNVEVLN